MDNPFDPLSKMEILKLKIEDLKEKAALRLLRGLLYQLVDKSIM